MTEPSKSILDSAGLRPEGTVLVLLAGDADRRWAADVAVDLSAQWAAQGRRIVLADLHLENPVLHLGLDVPNLEGVVDIFLYGASLSRIAKPVRNGSFYLIPAGTYAPDLEEIYRHPRWKKLVAGFRDTDATLILFAPAESVDLEALARWSSDAIILGTEASGNLRARLEGLSFRVLKAIDGDDGGVGAPAAAIAAPTPAPTRSDPEPEGDSPTGPVPERPPVTQVHRPPESELELPPPPVRRRRPRRTTSILLWVLFVVILLGTAAYLVAMLRPDLLQRLVGGSPAAVTAVVEEPAAAPAPTRTGELLPYSVQVRAFPSLNAALEELAADQARLDSVPFFISPEEIQGIVYYRILSGLATDTASAIRLRDRLVEIGAIDEEDAAGTWSLIQFTPLAFDLGEYASPTAAAARADSLIELEIPTYPATVEYSDGSRRWQLYAGAYPDSASSLRMREMLTAAGVEAPLSARTGQPAALPE